MTTVVCKYLHTGGEKQTLIQPTSLKDPKLVKLKEVRDEFLLSPFVWIDGFDSTFTAASELVLGSVSWVGWRRMLHRKYMHVCVCSEEHEYYPTQGERWKDWWNFNEHNYQRWWETAKRVQSRQSLLDLTVIKKGFDWKRWQHKCSMQEAVNE